MFEKKTREKIVALCYIVTATMIFYALDDYLLNFPIRQLFSCLILFSGFTAFLVHPRFARGLQVFDDALIFCVPMVVMVTVSLAIWFLGQVDISDISIAAGTYFVYSNQILAVLTAAASLYLFGEKAIWYNLAAALTANLIMIASVIAESGASAFFREFLTLVTTFADTTGSVIVQAEIHQLAFCTGVYLLYMMLFIKKNLNYLVLFLLSVFVFLAAFKRIAFVAIFISLAVGYIFRLLSRHMRPKEISKIITIANIVLCLLMLFYIWTVRMGAFEYLEEIGVNTMSRSEIYKEMERYYVFSPGYLGKGMGYLSNQLNNVLSLEVRAIHNDFLHYYIELGFWGYILWLLAMTLLRTRHFGKRGYVNEEINAFVITLYIFIVSSTDNTMHYQLVYMVISLVIMGHGFDRRVKEKEKQILQREGMWNIGDYL